MHIITKGICFFVFVGLLVGGVALVNAQEADDATEETIEEITLDETVEAAELDTKEPRLLPDSPFYFLKEWGRGIRSTFTFSKIKKLELESRFANERLIEARKLAEKKDDPKVIKKAMEKYRGAVEKVKERAEKLQEKAQDNPRIASFMEKYTKHQLLHQKVLERLEEKVPAEVLEKIKEAREQHLERFKDVMLKLEKKEHLTERLEKVLERQKGSDFKHIKQLETLKRLREKMPDDVKEKIIEAEGKVLRRLKDKVEGLDEEKHERFQKYLDKVGGDKEQLLEIVENLRAETADNPSVLRKLNTVRERVVDRVHKRTDDTEKECPELRRPTVNFCADGRIVIKKNDKGCKVDFRCVMPTKVRVPTRPSGDTDATDGGSGTTPIEKRDSNIQITPADPQPVLQ